ncbi:MAG: metal-dependent hydrolase [Porticoccaceae bacterium]
MDPFSQALLGATVAHAACGRKLGMRAAVWGAVAGAFPDIDVLFSVFSDEFSQLQLHRGITHSLFFGPVVGVLAGWCYWRWQRARGEEVARARWMMVFVLALLSHPLLDACTPYGTQLLAPFSDARFAWHAIPIIEPVYTLILLLGLIVAGFARSLGWLVSSLTLVLSCQYLAWGWFLNQQAIATVSAQLKKEGIEISADAERVHAFPTLFQMPRRRIVVMTDTEIRVGFITMQQPCDVTWDIAPRQQDPLLDQFRNTREAEIFTWFSDDIYSQTMEEIDSAYRVEISDMRYGATANARQGMWGVRAEYDREGEIIGPPRHFFQRPDMSFDRMLRVMKAAYPEADSGANAEANTDEKASCEQGLVSNTPVQNEHY